MGLDDNAIQAQHDRAAINFRVEPLLERLERAAGQRAAHHPHRVGFDFVLEQAADRFADALAGFQNDVADEPVADDDVHAVVEQIKTLAVAHEIEIQLRAQFRGGPGEIVALGFLRAIAQHADARLGDAQDSLPINAAHDGELREVRRLGHGIGTAVEHDEILGQGRKAARDGRPLHAVEAAQFHRAGHERAGVARRDHGPGFSGAHQFDGAHHRGIFFLADAFQRLVVHRQHFAGMDDFRARIGQPGLADGGLNVRLAPDHEDFFNGSVGCKRLLDAGNGDRTPVVAAHDIHRDSHK